MAVPIQLRMMEAAAAVVSDSIVSPQEAEWYMQFLSFAVLIFALGTLQWSLMMDLYDESVSEILPQKS